MKYFRILLFSVFGFLVFGPVNEAYGDGHKGDHHEGPPVFEDVDANADGAIDSDEAEAFFSQDPDFPADEFDEFFGIVDTNDDGVIDKEEWAADQAHDHKHHGDHPDGEPRGWHCAICDIDFDSAEEMDEHAEEAGHLKDRGKRHGKPHRDHDGDDHGDHHDGEPHDGWHCAICDLDFDSAEEMDEHAEEAGHLKDRGKPHGKPHRDHDGDDHGDHDGDDHGDHHGEEHHDGEPHDGWHCAICDLDFDSAEEMDEHAEEAGHLDDAGPTEGDFGNVDSSADGASGADGSSSK